MATGLEWGKFIVGGTNEAAKVAFGIGGMIMQQSYIDTMADIQEQKIESKERLGRESMWLNVQLANIQRLMNQDTQYAMTERDAIRAEIEKCSIKEQARVSIETNKDALRYSHLERFYGRPTLMG